MSFETSEATDQIATALAKAQSEMHGAAKDGKNPAFRSTYASLASVIEAARGPLTAHGIAFIQAPGRLGEGVIGVTTALFHSSGQWIRSTIEMPIKARDNPQAVGSATTYACRYSLMAMLGLPPVDDDGNAAMERPDATERRSPAPQMPSPPVPAKGADTPSPASSEPKILAFIKESLLSVTGQRSLVQWELDNSILFDSLSTEGKIEIEQAKKDRIAELKRRAA
jgi:hypothetical protein